jgi:hypothetical protein
MRTFILLLQRVGVVLPSHGAGSYHGHAAMVKARPGW